MLLMRNALLAATLIAAGTFAPQRASADKPALELRAGIGNTRNEGANNATFFAAAGLDPINGREWYRHVLFEILYSGGNVDQPINGADGKERDVTEPTHCAIGSAQWRTKFNVRRAVVRGRMGAGVGACYAPGIPTGFQTEIEPKTGAVATGEVGVEIGGRNMGLEIGARTVITDEESLQQGLTPFIGVTARIP